MAEHCIIQADSDSQALTLGAAALKCDLSGLDCSLLKKGLYYCHLKQANWHCSIRIAPNRKRVLLTEMFPSFLPNFPLTLDKVLDQLQSNGIIAGILRDELAKAVDEINQSRLPVFNIEAAKQIEAEAGKPACFSTNIASASFVRKGTLLGQKKKTSAGKPGITIYGAEIPTIPGAERDIAFGENLSLTPEQNFIADISGYLTHDEKSLSIQPLIRVSPDGLKATLSLRREASGEVLSLKTIRVEIAEGKIRQGLKLDALESAFQHFAGSKDSVMEMLIAEGTAPKPGKDGKVDFKVKLEKTIGQLLLDGRMDYRERNMPQSIPINGLICEILSPEPGQDGIDVFGAALPYETGKEVKASPGANVRAEDGKQFFAEINGIVMFKKGVVSVHTGYEHNGDVDFNSGHLDCQGYAIINGSVRSTFNVSAKAHITITGTAGDSLLRADGDIDVLKGIFHSHYNGRVISRGTVRTSMATQAWIEADEDIVIGGEAMNCNLKANGKVLCVERKGTIIGGTVRGSAGIEAKVAGSETGSKTILKVGYDLMETEEMRKQMNRFRREIQLIHHVIGEECTEEKIAKCKNPKQRKIFGELFAFREESKKLLDDLIAERRRMMDQRKKLGKVSIRILDTAYPDVELYIYDLVLKVPVVMKRVEFMLNAEGEQIISRNLT